MDRIAKTFYIIVISFQLWTLVSGGSCWWSVTSKNKADVSTLLASNVTRQQCCRLEPSGEKFYSDDNEPSSASEKIKWRYGHPHKCVAACLDGCTSFAKRCGEAELCRIKSNGIPKCLCNPLCSKNSLSQKGPICGSDGKTYSHHCQLLRNNCRQGRSISVAYYGECQAYSCGNVQCATEGARCFTDQYNRPRCHLSSSPCNADIENPICGTDGQTYPSMCHMTQHNLNNSLSVKLSYHGNCTDSAGCNQDKQCKRCLYDQTFQAFVCILTEMPTCWRRSPSFEVCGTDGQTYESECALNQHRYITGQHITVLHIAACNATNEEILVTGKRANDPKAGANEDEVIINLIKKERHRTPRRNKKRRAAKKRRTPKH
ncbi:follistatin-like [Watersipora subatra]|uniref:follistatin-like n=1 Tax=Watersipora subatra TaxID=2589382 RepID=UPI00355AD3DC